MNKLSYCADVKNTLKSNLSKRNCCNRTFRNTMKYCENDVRLPNELSRLSEKFKCGMCRNELLKAFFINFGSVTDPEKEYHLEFAFKNRWECDFIRQILVESGFSPKDGIRKDCYILYFKESGAIEDILAFMGANSAAFDFMNKKIVKELRNSTNRIVNCETANIEKSINASQKYIEAIKILKENDLFETLPPQLYQTAVLREKYKQMSLSELAENCDPKISKSGVKHRLEKIMEIAKDVKNQGGD